MKLQNLHLALVAAGLGLISPALATNGTNLIGVGPNSRSLGGTGVAAPQDAISAVFSNPAAMCLSPACAAPQADFAISAFMPNVSTKINLGGMSFEAESADRIYPIPALGVSLPFGEASRMRGGFAIYGVSGLGVDYRGTAVDTNIPGTPFPLLATPRTELQVMKMAPSIAYSFHPDFSVGVSVHMDYATLNLNQGKKSDWGAGVQVGATWKPMQQVTIGATYITEQPQTFGGVFDFTGDGVANDLKLAIPQQAALGVAWTGLDNRLLLEVDGRWINWGDADGYSDFDWKDQWTVGLGAQYELIPKKLFLRAGYNYGKNPLENNTIGGAGPGSNYYQETLRVVGFPAIVEHHLGLGFGYQITDTMVFNFGWVHAFNASFTQTGVAPDGRTPVSVTSDLTEDSIDFGLTWRF